MAKIPRALQKLFASTAAATELGKFGSLAAGSPAYAADTDEIQSLANYLGGWYDAIIGNNSPAIEDRNALDYLFSYQLAYMMQTGVPEWIATQTYYVGSFCSVSGVIYVSTTDDNLNNLVTDTDNWTEILKDVAPMKRYLGSMAARKFIKPDYPPLQVDTPRGIAWSDTLNMFMCVGGVDNSPGFGWYSYDGNAWKETMNISSSSPTDSLHAVVWGNGQFVCVGHYGQLMRTPDGTSWSSGSISGSFAKTSIAFSQELNLFCAVSSNSVAQPISTSPDGITWTLRSAPATRIWGPVVWSPSLGIFCCVAESMNDVAMISSDGISWSENSMLPSNADTWTDMAWSEELGLFCVVGEANNSSESIIATSPDGINWTQRYMYNEQPIRAYTLHSIAWSPELGVFCVGVNTAGNANIKCLYSYDGINWLSGYGEVDSTTGYEIEYLGWSPHLGVFTSGLFTSL